LGLSFAFTIKGGSSKSSRWPWNDQAWSRCYASWTLKIDIGSMKYLLYNFFTKAYNTQSLITWHCFIDGPRLLIIREPY